MEFFDDIINELVYWMKDNKGFVAVIVLISAGVVEGWTIASYNAHRIGTMIESGECQMGRTTKWIKTIRTEWFCDSRVYNRLATKQQVRVYLEKMEKVRASW